MHFAEDREQFGQLLQGLTASVTKHQAALVIRPRERAPVHVDVHVVPRTPSDGGAWLWFFTRPEHALAPARRPERPLSDASPPHTGLSS